MAANGKSKPQIVKDAEAAAQSRHTLSKVQRAYALEQIQKANSLRQQADGIIAEALGLLCGELGLPIPQGQDVRVEDGELVIG